MRLLIVILIHTIMTVGFCFAQDDYLRLDTGFSSARDPHLEIPTPFPVDLGHSSIVGGGFGLHLDENVRVDFTISYRGGFNQVSGFPQMPTRVADLHSMIGMASFYYDFGSDNWITPYLGGGAGFSRNSLDAIDITDADGSPFATIEGASKWDVAWQVSGGVTVDLNHRWAVDAGYRYFDAGSYKSEDAIIFVSGESDFAQNTGDLKMQEFQIGVRLKL